MAFASKFAGMLFLASCAAAGLSAQMSGCIATDTIEFVPEENFPPSIVSQQNALYPLNQIGQLELPSPPEGELVLEVIIRDPNFGQTLEYRTFLDSPPPPDSDLFIETGPIEPSGFLEREWEFTVDYARLTPGICHKIEIVVVGEFERFELRQPVEPGDVDQATWWIEVLSDGTLERCK